jgi:hypothetical protein
VEAARGRGRDHHVHAVAEQHRTGISASWTDQYMGSEAARNLGEVDTSEFVLHNGVMCTVETQSCATHGKSNKTSKKIQMMVFGK